MVAGALPRWSPLGADALIAVAALWTVAVVTPGPNALMVTGTALSHGRISALACAAGVASGTAVWGAAGLAGFGVLITTLPDLYIAMKVVGGLYIAWLGVQSLRSALAYRPAAQAATPHRSGSLARAWRRGILTSLANPKTAAFVGSLFVVALPADASPALGLASVAVMVAISITWYGLAAVALSHRVISQAYLRAKRWIDGLVGGFFIAFGLRLAWER